MFLVDSSKKSILINLFKLEPYLEKNIQDTISPKTITDYKKYKTIGDFYTIIDINDFRQSKIIDLLNKLIEYYRINRNHNIIKYIPNNYKYAYYFKEYNSANNLQKSKTKKNLKNNLVSTKKKLRKIKKRENKKKKKNNILMNNIMTLELTIIENNSEEKNKNIDNVDNVVN